MAKTEAKGIEHGTQVGRRGGGNAGEAKPKGLARRRDRSILALLIGFAIGVWLGIAPVASATVPVSPSEDLLGPSSALDRALSEAVSVDGAEVAPPVTPTVERPAGDKPQIVADYGRLPMHFEPNVGQTAEEVRFLARGPGYSLFLTDTEAVMVLRQGRSEQEGAAASATDTPPPDAPPGARQSSRLHGSPSQRPSEADPPAKTAVVRMRLEGATLNAAPVVTGLDRQPGISNYFLGNDPAKWRTEIPHYARVQYDEVYPGIDLVFYGNPQQLEYDFVVAPGADPEQIRLAVSGSDAVRVNEQGDLVLSIAGGELVQRAPRIYQEIDGEQRAVAGGYRLLPMNAGPGAEGTHETLQVTSSNQPPAQIGFELAAYDQSQGLVIDPVLVYSTYLGGSENEEGYSIAVDIAGNTYVTGWTFSSDFPTVNAIYPNPYLRDSDAFIFKLNAAGTAAFYSTYLGGSGRDTPSSITVDSAGNAYVTGDTHSSDFPTVNALYPNLSGYHDAFIFKLNATGSAALYSTYLGGSNSEHQCGIAVDDAGNAYVTGATGSLDFPTVNALYPNHSGEWDAFVFKLNATGSVALYSTYLGGSKSDRGWSIAVDIAGNAYVTGITESSDFPTVNALYPNLSGYYDAFVFKLNAEGSAALYSTYLGGSDLDWGHDIAVDDAGNTYVTGHTESSDFPTFNALHPSPWGNEDAFVFKLNATGSAAVYSTYLGGSSDDSAHGIAVDDASNAYVTGVTYSRDFPTVNALYPNLWGLSDAFVFKLNAAGSAAFYSTYLGGSHHEGGLDIAVDDAGNAYITGTTSSSDFPTVNPLYPNLWGITDAFITKIADAGDPASIRLDVLDARDYWTGSGLTDDTTLLANPSLGRPMTGAAADGVARLLLRARVPGPGRVHFGLTAAAGPASGNGKLSRDGFGGAAELVQDVECSDALQGCKAFAVYLAPEGFTRPGFAADADLWQRGLRVTATFEPETGPPPPPVSRNIQLTRPPVVLVHGFNSNSETWNVLEEKLADRVPGLWIAAVDYRYSNMAPFDHNWRVPAAAVILARNAYRSAGIAAAQADVIGHSMGGILGRLWADEDNAELRRATNYWAGDFNKLITIDSPHSGSPWADALALYLGEGDAYRRALEALYQTSLDHWLGAIEDLETGSDALCAMGVQPTEVPAHAVVGNYVPTVDDLADLGCLAAHTIREPTVAAVCKVWNLMRFAGFDTGVSTHFPLGGDLVVGVGSQEDGFSSGDPWVSELSHIHMAFLDRPSALETDAVADRLVTLLNAPSTDADLFSQGFPTSSCAVQRFARAGFQQPMAESMSDGLTITNPTDDAVVEPGEHGHLL